MVAIYGMSLHSSERLMAKRQEDDLEISRLDNVLTNKTLVTEAFALRCPAVILHACRQSYSIKSIMLVTISHGQRILSDTLSILSTDNLEYFPDKLL